MGDYSLLIRADADANTGSGHVLRCLALAQACQTDHGEVTFLMSPSAPALEQRILSEGFDVKILSEKSGSKDDAVYTSKLAKKIGCKWIVVDGYHFGADYQKILKMHRCCVLLFDDYGHSEHYYADLVLNQNLSDGNPAYQNAEYYTRFLLGTRYVLLRKEFLQSTRGERRIPDIARKVLVTFGGGDSENITLNIIKALKSVSIENLEVVVLIGSVNRYADAINKSLADRVESRAIFNTEKMPELMQWADIAISAGGGTCWELAFMGLPSIIIPIADNQKQTVSVLQEKGQATVIRKEDTFRTLFTAKKITNLLLSREVRQSSSQFMRALLDGQGSHRVVLCMSSREIMMRPVVDSDCDLVFSWINDREVRNNSFNTGRISHDDHCAWFSRTIADKDIIYYIALDIYSRPVGQVRIAITGESGEISILLDKEHRGMNLGSKLIRCGTERFFKETGIDSVKAYIKKANVSSLKAFQKAGYISLGLTKIRDQTAYHVIKRRDN